MWLRHRENFSGAASLVITLGVIIGLLIGFFIARWGFAIGYIPLVLSLGFFFLFLLFKLPKLGLFAVLVYSFLLFALIWELDDFPFGIGVECLLLMTLLASIFDGGTVWKNLKNPLVYTGIIWLAITLLELFNPYDGSLRGWLQEARSVALYPLFFSVLTLLLMRHENDLNIFLFIVIAFSVLASINGVKQLTIGPWPGEQRFLDHGGALTHIIWGQLRVFSFYSDAGQFGASQAHITLLCLVLVLAGIRWWQKCLLILLALLSFYGMLISGTRGALFALIIGLFFAIMLCKKLKIAIVGAVLVILFLGCLKFTHIGSSYYPIYRLRTALDFSDASLNVRIQNQQTLARYLQNKPFGAGLGTIGKWGKEYNSDKFLSTIEPDSYWVKIWASYGIVGLICWFGMMAYMLGQCCGICWQIQDKTLRVKGIALTAGIAGILFCSYGNEVMNAFPSSAIVWISWGLVYQLPKFENLARLSKITEKKAVNEEKGVWVLEGAIYQYVNNERK